MGHDHQTLAVAPASVVTCGTRGACGSRHPYEQIF